jgi:hypothetical protein
MPHKTNVSGRHEWGERRQDGGGEEEEVLKVLTAQAHRARSLMEGDEMKRTSYTTSLASTSSLPRCDTRGKVLPIPCSAQAGGSEGMGVGRELTCAGLITAFGKLELGSTIHFTRIDFDFITEHGLSVCVCDCVMCDVCLNRRVQTVTASLTMAFWCERGGGGSGGCTYAPRYTHTHGRTHPHTHLHTHARICMDTHTYI